MHGAVDLIEVIVGRVATSFRSAYELTSTAKERLSRALGADPNFEEIEELLLEFDFGVKSCEAAIKAPEVVIVTTGTTSSGKSTLANLLLIRPFEVSKRHT
jgi:hypothetical protein